MINVRIEYPFYASFQTPEFESNSRELRSIALHGYLHNSGMELDGEVESFQVTSWRGDDDGEFWEVEKQ